MKSLRPPAFILGLLYLCFYGYLVFFAPQLPDRVATHFNFQGQPDGWMGRSTHLLAIALLGFASPLGIVGLFSLIRLFPQGLNVPHREYWLAPARRVETYSFLHRQSLWFACMALSFVIGLHFSVIQANRLPNAHLSSGTLASLAGCFIIGATVWIVAMLLHC